MTKYEKTKREPTKYWQEQVMKNKVKLDGWSRTKLQGHLTDMVFEKRQIQAKLHEMGLNYDNLLRADRGDKEAGPGGGQQTSGKNEAIARAISASEEEGK